MGKSPEETEQWFSKPDLCCGTKYGWSRRKHKESQRVIYNKHFYCSNSINRTIRKIFQPIYVLLAAFCLLRINVLSNSIFKVQLGLFARMRTCNPSKWEADIWGWLEVRSAMLHCTVNQRPHCACRQYGYTAVHWGSPEVAATTLWLVASMASEAQGRQNRKALANSKNCPESGIYFKNWWKPWLLYKPRATPWIVLCRC